MAGPWEKYQDSAAAPTEPWAKYAGAADVEPPPESSDKYDRSMLLPVSRNRETGEIEFATPGLVKGLIESGTAAITAPGRAMRGELDVTGDDGSVTPEAIEEALNMAVWGTPAAAGRVPLGPKAAAKPKSEGLEVAEAAARQGIDMPVAAVSDKIAVQQAGKTVSDIPLAGAPLRKASDKAIGSLDDAMRKLEQGFGTGSSASAGAMVRSDVASHAKTVLPDRVSALYDAVDKLVQPNVVTQLMKTRKVAGDIVAGRKNAMLPGDSKAVAMIAKAANSPQGLNYEGIKNLRTTVGELVDDPQKLAASGMSGGELKRIYGALTEDLQASVSKNGKPALKAWQDANSFAAKSTAERKSLQKVIGRDRSDEGIVESLHRMAGSTSTADITRLKQARGAVSKETWDELSSAVLAKMGRDAEGNFSPDRFMTAYGRLSKDGKSVLFNSTGKKELASALDDIATVSKRFKQLKQFSNPSGTGQTVLTGSIGFGLAVDPLTTLSSVAGGRVLANLLSKPATAKKVASWTAAYERAARLQYQSSYKLLENRTKALSAIVAAERGTAIPILRKSDDAIADQENQNPVTDDQSNQRQGKHDPYTI